MSTDVYHEARFELKGFLYESPKFRNDLEKIIIKFIDQKFLLSGFSPTISSLIKTMQTLGVREFLLMIVNILKF